MESSKKCEGGSSRSTKSNELIITPQSKSCKRAARLMILKMEIARHAQQRRRIIMYKKRMVNKFCSINMESSKKCEGGSSRSTGSNEPIILPQSKSCKRARLNRLMILNRSRESCAYSHSVVGLNGVVITTTTAALEEVVSHLLPTSELAGNDTIILIHDLILVIIYTANHHIYIFLSFDLCI